jgi:hypothetical protein
MRMPVVIVWILCLVVASAATAPVAAPVAAQDDDVEVDDADGQTIDVRLETDGDAVVSVTQRFALENEEDHEAFDRLAREFEGGDADGELSATVFERIAEGASESADREMAIEDVVYEAETDESAGTLELRFRWTNFAATPDDRIEVGDAFVSGGETWLPSLSDDQRLVVRAPEEYAVDVANPDASVNNGTLVWEGPRQFESGEPNATLVPSSRISEGVSVLSVGVGLALVGAIVLLVYLLSRRRTAAPERGGSEAGGLAGLIGPVAGNGGEETVEPAEPEPAPVPEPAAEPDDPFGGVDPELLSDEERVVRLLEANDGRMKQATIVVETDWSNAKVSQLLSSMAEEGRIEKLRIGRENLITLVEDEDGD